MGKRFARKAMWMFGSAALVLGGIVLSGCNSVLGYADFQADGCPSKGVRRCEGNVPQVCQADGSWRDESPCTHQVCQDGHCIGECEEGEVRCGNNTPQSCDENGHWQDGPEGPCVNQTCDLATLTCIGECAPGQGQCLGQTLQGCDPSGQWQSKATCQDACTKGQCTECMPGDVGCSAANSPQTCNASGQWEDDPAGPCMHQTCDPMSGMCIGVCAPGDTQCVGTTPQSCDEKGQWKAESGCAAGEYCQGGKCIAECIPGDLQCSDNNTPQSCDENGHWQDRPEGPCVNQTCDVATVTCIGVCAPGQGQCLGQTLQGCDPSGQWQSEATCQDACTNSQCTECMLGQKGCSAANSPQTCNASGQWEDDPAGPCMHQTCDPMSGMCIGVCAPDETQCVDITPRSCDEQGQWKDEPLCAAGEYCQGGKCIAECIPGDSRCSGNTPQSCDENGHWQDRPEGPCVNQTCDLATVTCIGECAPEQRQCTGQTPQSCDASGQWQDEAACMNQTCVSGACIGVCAPGELRCSANTRQSCDVNGQWQDEAACVNQTCVSGACIGVCAPGQGQCTGQTPQSCGPDGQWKDGPACLVACVSGLCADPNCAGVAATCGPLQDESCCASSVVVGGTYNRSNDPSYPATVSDFRLDRFEITVGRFRKYVEGYPGSKPMAGAGAHPLIANSGWNPAWDGSLPVDQAALKAAVKCSGYPTWTDTAGGNENLPMSCISWYDAFAFCAWDGGRLPTEAEWNYAAAGGAEQRAYPWSNPPGSTAIDATYAVYNCLGDGNSGCSFADILKVGSKSSKGDGKWGQADLGGSMWEWNLDWYGSYQIICNNCANVQSGSDRVLRGGSWYGYASSLLSWGRYNGPPATRYIYIGARCARTP